MPAQEIDVKKQDGTMNYSLKMKTSSDEPPAAQSHVTSATEVLFHLSKLQHRVGSGPVKDKYCCGFVGITYIITVILQILDHQV